MKKAHTTLVVLALAAALGGAWWLQNRPSGQVAAAVPPAAANRAPGGPAAVEVGAAQVMRLEDAAQAVGTLRANQGVMLRPEVSGRVQRIGFTDGQRVRKGQLLVQMDDTLQVAQLAQAKAAAAIARTNLQRNRELVAQNFVSQSVVDQSQAALEVADAQVALAQAQLERMKMFAPFDAIAGIRAIAVGDYIKDGADVVQLEDVSSVWVDFRLPERYLAQLRTGQSVAVTLDALPGRALTAQVAAVDSQLDASGRSVLVRARLTNPGGELRSGLFARARIVFGVREAAVTVPEEALVPLGNEQFLVKVIPGPDGSRIGQRIAARLGARVPGRVEILEGLKAGDTVVVAGQARVMGPKPVPLRVVQSGGSAAPAPSAPRPAASGAA